MDLLMNKDWWKAALTRCLKTIAQTILSLIGVSAVQLSDVDWFFVLSAGLLAGFLSIVTSIAGLPEVKEKKEDISDE